MCPVKDIGIWAGRHNTALIEDSHMESVESIRIAGTPEGNLNPRQTGHISMADVKIKEA
jgi:hypothetical protein